MFLTSCGRAKVGEITGKPEETAGIDTRQDATESGEDINGSGGEADSVEYDTVAHCIIKPMGSNPAASGTSSDDDSIDRYGYTENYEYYFDKMFNNAEKNADDYYAAFCLVSVIGVNNEKTAEEKSANYAVMYDKQRVKIEIKRILKATKNAEEKGLPKETEVAEAITLVRVKLNENGEMINGITLNYPVLEIGSEYIIFMSKNYSAENAKNFAYFLTVPLNGDVLDKEYLKDYYDNYAISNNAYNTCVKYMNMFLFDMLSDPRMKEKLEYIGDFEFDPYYL